MNQRNKSKSQWVLDNLFLIIPLAFIIIISGYAIGLWHTWLVEFESLDCSKIKSYDTSELSFRMKHMIQEKLKLCVLE